MQDPDDKPVEEETLWQSFRSSIFPVHPNDPPAKRFVKRSLFYTFAGFLLLITIAIGSVMVLFL